MTRLEMLWEAVEPAAALASRFGFTDVEQAVVWLRDAGHDEWGARFERCDRLVISDRNLLAWLTVDERPLIAKCCGDPSRFSRLAQIDSLIEWLHAEGIPVAAAIPAADGRVRVERGELSAGLYPVVRGGLLDVGDPAQVAAAGRTLAALHSSLAAYPVALDAEPVPAAHQLVHGDFRSANLLVEGGRISAVLDFDEVRRSTRIADLAQAAVLLGTRYHDWAPTSPQIRNAFVAAYAELIPLSESDHDELRSGVSAVLNHFGWT